MVDVPSDRAHCPQLPRIPCSPRYPFDVPLAGPNSRRYRSNMFASTIVASFLIKL
jgi:hypothetical protein